MRLIVLQVYLAVHRRASVCVVVMPRNSVHAFVLLALVLVLKRDVVCCSLELLGVLMSLLLDLLFFLSPRHVERTPEAQR